MQTPRHGGVLDLKPGETLGCTTRTTFMSTMTVLGDPGEVYLLTHSVLRAKIGLPTTARVELLDPVTLKTRHASPRLRGGPMWPGGMAIHRNGSLYVVYGRYLHRLDRVCKPTGMLELPVNQPYNSFVVLDNGLIVTKNLSDATAATLTVVDPETMQRVCNDLVCPEPSIARLSAAGNTLYVVGVRTIFRYHWNEEHKCLLRDEAWSYDYVGGTQQSYGWDVVLDADNAWFMDNGRHRYFVKMIGAGVNPTPNRLIRVSLRDSADHQAWEISGLTGGSVTNPPLVDPVRSIVVAFDSANAVLRAWRWDRQSKELIPLWRKQPFGAASHMILYSESGELVVNDYRRHGEEVVVLHIESGEEKGRVRVGGLNQGVVFPSTGWGRDFYWSSMAKVARVFVR
jgi:hypothetical protein